MINIAKDVGKALIPPGMDPVLLWRLTVSVSVGALLAFVLWAMGLVGNGGFAHAEDLEKISRRQLESKLDNVHTVLCMEGADPQLLLLARELEIEYRLVNRGQPYLVNCDLLLKLKHYAN